ncbi:MAG: ferrochelatase [Polyangiales bacterium]
MSTRGLLIIAFGGPHKNEDVRPFLRDVLAGRPVPEARFESVVHHYELLGGRSPITQYTQEQATKLSEELQRRGHTLPTRVGMRHWSPWIRSALEEFAREGVEELLGVIMAAQETEASLARYQEAVEKARSEIPNAPRVRYVTGWGLQESLIEAHACNVARTYARLPLDARAGASLLFTAHSIPVPMAKASPYVQQLEETARRVAEKVGVREHKLVYQSRSGSPRDPWLEPDILDALDAEARAGSRDVLVAPIGFLCDHVEVLYDLDIEAQQKARELGIQVHRVPTLGAHPAFIRTLADAVERALGD